jgi:hypothetical protein
MTEQKSRKPRPASAEVKLLRAEVALLRSIVGELLDSYDWGRGKISGGKITFFAEMEEKRYFALARQVYELGRESAKIQNYFRKLEQLLVWSREFDRLEVAHIFQDRAAEMHFDDIRNRFRNAMREIEAEEPAESGQGFESVERTHERREE